MSTKRKVAAVLITTVALSAGTVGVASADSKSKNRQVSAQGVKGFRGDITAFLASLVAKGTITQAQADAIIAAANAAKSAADAMRPTKPDQAAQLARLFGPKDLRRKVLDYHQGMQMQALLFLDLA